MALHEFPPGDESTGVNPEGKPFRKLCETTPGFDPAELKPKFTERLSVCLYCHDTAFVRVGDGPLFNYRPCNACSHGLAINRGWWKEATEWRDNRWAGPEANRRLIDPWDNSDTEPPI